MKNLLLFTCSSKGGDKIPLMGHFQSQKAGICSWKIAQLYVFKNKWHLCANKWKLREVKICKMGIL